MLFAEERKDGNMSYETLLDQVTRVAAEALEQGGTIGNETVLTDLPAFDSLALVRLIAALESVLDISFPLEAVLPDTFERPSSIAKTIMEYGLISECKA